jgi:hypothetical protein
MNDPTLQEPQRKKRVYQKPELVQVPLRPEEAVLGFCKKSGAHGPGQSACNTVACFTIGS